MAQNETSVSADVVWQDGDGLSETNLTRTAAKTNLTDYVERGLGFSVDHASDTVDIGSGHVIIQDGINAYDLFPNQQTDISLPDTSGINYVFVAHDPSTDDDVYYHIDNDDTPPSDPALKTGTIDTANDTSDDTINRNPAGDFRTVDINGATVLEANGLVASSAIPDLAITETYVVADKTERLNLDAEEGDLAVQQDVDETYIFTGGDPSNDDDWSEIVTSPAQHATSHEKGGSDELTTFGDTTHDSVSTKELASERHYASAYDGSDPDTRLANAVSAASSGDTIYLENADYDGSQTFASQYYIIGTGRGTNGTNISGATWTVSSPTVIKGIAIANSNTQINIDADECAVHQCRLGGDTDILVSNDHFIYTGNFSGSVTFESGTSGGIVDGCTKTTVTDNGSNTTGDVA